MQNTTILSENDFRVFSHIKSFKEVAQKTNLKGSVVGITVNGTGLPIEGIEFVERSANLSLVRNLEEQERDRRIVEEFGSQQFNMSGKFRLNQITTSLEEGERLRRTSDLDGSEEYRELLAHQVTAHISKDILLQSSRLGSIARGAVDGAKQAGQDMINAASGFAQRAKNFLGNKVASGVAAINENLHEISEKAVERAQEFGGQASEAAGKITDQAIDKVHDIAGKVALQAQNLKAQAQDHVENLTIKTTSSAHNLGESAIHFGAQKYGDALRLIAIGRLDLAEETERQYRTTIGLSVEKFQLALRTSSLIREHLAEKEQEVPQVNSWYGTGIVEEFERRRRIQHDQSHPTSQNNAKKLGQLIHLRNIHTETHRPQAKQLEKVSAIIEKKAEEIRAAPVRAMAAM